MQIGKFIYNYYNVKMVLMPKDRFDLSFRAFMKIIDNIIFEFKPSNYGGDDGGTEPWQNNASTRDPPFPEPPYFFSEED